MKRKTLATLFGGLCVAGVAEAQTVNPAPTPNPWLIEGSVTAGPIVTDQSGRDTSKLQEYQDLNNGVLSNILFRGRDDKLWIDAYGENFGRDDMYVSVRGGQYDRYKYRIYTNWLPHNFAFNAVTPYNGTGSNLLVGTFPSPNPGTWNSFVLGYERKDTGGYFEWQGTSPWYFRVDGNQVSFSGTKVGSGANGTSPGNGYVDLAFPTQYTTDNWGVEGGYQSGKATFAVRWDYSKFHNDNETLQWTNPFFGQNQLDSSYLPPGNTFNKFTLSGNYRDLPWRSVVSARYTWSKTTSDVGIGLTALDSGGVYNPTMPNTNTFNGEHINQSLALAWTANPV